jgi:hypothetical protein
MRRSVTAEERRQAEREYALKKVYGDDAIIAKKIEKAEEGSVAERDSYLTMRLKTVAVGIPSNVDPWDDDTLSALQKWAKTEYPKIQDAVNYVTGAGQFDDKRKVAFNHLLKLYPGIANVVGADAFAEWRRLEGYRGSSAPATRTRVIEDDEDDEDVYVDEDGVGIE